MNMKLAMMHVSIFALVVYSTGCASYPMGLSREQWDALPPEKQADYRAQQYQIDEQRRQQAEAQQLQQQQAAAAQARAEQERIAALYANAHYGDIVNVALSSGIMIDGRNQYRTEPASIDLVRGEIKAIQIRGQNGTRFYNEDIRVRFSDDGNTIYLNEKNIGMDRVALVNQAWNQGNSYALQPFKNDFGVVFQGLTATIKFKSMAGEPRRLIIEHE